MRERKLFVLCFDTSFSTQIFFLKKIDRQKIALITSFTILLTSTLLNLFMQDYFPLNLAPFSLLHSLILSALIFVCENLFICQNLFLYVRESLTMPALTFISENLFISVRISSCAYGSIFICENVFLSMITSEISYLRLRE